MSIKRSYKARPWPQKLGIWAGTGVISVVTAASISSCASSPPQLTHQPPASSTSERAIAPEATPWDWDSSKPSQKPATQKPATEKPAPEKPAQKPAAVAADRDCDLRAHGDLPDPACTPGEADQRVTQSNIQGTICVAGYTKTVRPSSYVTNKMKFGTSYPMYHLDRAVKTEYDHLIPLELGGKSSIRNLWPDPTPVIPTAKDAAGHRLHARVCDGRMSLAAAQRIMATDWRAAPPAPVTEHKPPAPEPNAPESASGYHWRQQANGLRCVDGDGQFAKSALCGARP